MVYTVGAGVGGGGVGFGVGFGVGGGVGAPVTSTSLLTVATSSTATVMVVASSVLARTTLREVDEATLIDGIIAVNSFVVAKEKKEN